MLTYKVVEIRQKSMLKGIMTAAGLQDAINQWANQGWALDRITSGETAHFLGGKDVFLLIFKKDIEIPEGFHLMIKNHPVAITNLQQFNLIRQNNVVTNQTLACTQDQPEWKPLGEVMPDLSAFVFEF